jgi:hypothetical protein
VEEFLRLLDAPAIAGDERRRADEPALARRAAQRRDGPADRP